ncbi:MAG TPA: TaqI-like C-terminal specificity domain-containing protein, partial [Anaerolineaceae bacterium]|nr:TaqI-like C-terminal specificity domain-containing protein [Anaerolineaceae bacterium]
SLLLKVLEGESGQLSLGLERALPDLGRNIQCGNSLIGEDYFAGQLVVDEEERWRVNPFEWRHAFPQVFAQGGFNAVIGNPPYLGGREWKEENGRKYDYFVKKYYVAEYQFDIYSLFWERGIEILNCKGFIGIITPNTWLNNQSNLKLREFILANTSVILIVDYSKANVFEKVVVLPIVTILRKGKIESSQVSIFRGKDNYTKFLHEISQDIWNEDQLKIFNIDLTGYEIAVREKIEKEKQPLQNFALIKFGVKLYETGKGHPPQKPNFASDHVYEASDQIDKTYRRFLEGKDIQPYRILYKNRWLKYGNNLAAPRDPELFNGNRILVRRIVSDRLICAYTDEDFVTSQLLQIVKPNNPRKSKAILGVLNSSLMAFFFRKKFNRQDKTFPEIRIYELSSLPFPDLESNVIEVEQNYEIINNLVEKMLILQEQIGHCRIPFEEEQLRRQIAATDRQIDQLVYQLYGLTEEEIRIVEGQ